MERGLQGDLQHLQFNDQQQSGGDRNLQRE
jgi:hypothetical protein